MDEEFSLPEEAGLSGPQLQTIQELGAVTAQGGKAAIHCLTIVGQIVIIDSKQDSYFIRLTNPIE